MSRWEISTALHGIKPLMADEDVIQDRPSLAPSPHRDRDHPRRLADAPTNGQDTGSHGDRGAARLRGEFVPRIAAAWSRFRAASEEMQEAAVALRDQGRPPSYELVFALGECHREYLRLGSELTRRADTLSVPLPPLDTPGGVGELARMLESLAAAVPPELPSAGVPDEKPVEEEVPERPTEPMPAPVEPAAPASYEVDEPSPPVPGPEALDSRPSPATEEPEHPGESVRLYALGVLDTIAQLRYRGGGEFPPLRDCQARAEALRDEVARSPASNLPGEAAQLAAGEHAFDGLLNVVGGIQTLSDAEWAAVHAKVSEAFGRPLAVAAARGRLVVAPPRQDG